MTRIYAALAALALMLVASPALASVHAGDELVVAVFDHPELSGPAVVDGNAHISVPLAGSVDVRGLEPDQIAARLQQQLRKYLLKPAVTVQLKSQQPSIFISGGPGGTLKYEPGETLMTALGDVAVKTAPTVGRTASAGDISDLQNSRLDLRRVGLIRDEKSLGTFDAIDLSSRGNSGPQLQSGDTLALSYKQNAVRVIGNVQRPGLTYLSDDQPLSDAIAQAGGALLSASTSRIELRRDGKTQLLAMGDDQFNKPSQNGDTITVPTAPRVSINGLVEKPGAVVLKTDRTLLTALYEAGGPSKWADLSHVVLIQNGAKTYYDVTKLAYGDLSQNPSLSDGDVVFVPEGHKINATSIFQSILSAVFLLK